MFLRPEGENGGSSVANVVPEFDRWNDEVHNPIGIDLFTKLNIEG